MPAAAEFAKEALRVEMSRRMRTLSVVEGSAVTDSGPSSLSSRGDKVGRGGAMGEREGTTS